MLEKLSKKSGVSVEVWREIAKDQTDEFMLKHPHLVKRLGKLDGPVNKKTIAAARKKYEAKEEGKEKEE